MTGVLVSVQFPVDAIRRIEAAARQRGQSIRWIHLPADPEARLDDATLAAIDVAFYSVDIYETVNRAFFSAVRKAPNVRWLHVFNVGVDHPIFAALLAPGMRITTSAGTERNADRTDRDRRIADARAPLPALARGAAPARMAADARRRAAARSRRAVVVRAGSGQHRRRNRAARTRARPARDRHPAQPTPRRRSDRGDPAAGRARASAAALPVARDRLSA